MITIIEEREKLIALTMIKRLCDFFRKCYQIKNVFVITIIEEMEKLIAFARMKKLCDFFRKHMKKLIYLQHLQQTLFLKWGT